MDEVDDERYPSNGRVARLIPVKGRYVHFTLSFIQKHVQSLRFLIFW